MQIACKQWCKVLQMPLIDLVRTQMTVKGNICNQNHSVWGCGVREKSIEASIGENQSCSHSDSTSLTVRTRRLRTIGPRPTKCQQRCRGGSACGDCYFPDSAGTNVRTGHAIAGDVASCLEWNGWWRCSGGRSWKCWRHLDGNARVKISR